MKIPIDKLEKDLLVSIVEEFVLRDGTDYGAVEIEFDNKVDEFLRKLRTEEYFICFDAVTDSLTIKLKSKTLLIYFQ